MLTLGGAVNHRHELVQNRVFGQIGSDPVKQRPHVNMQRVADVERDRQPHGFVQRGRAAPLFRIVLDVVVDEDPALKKFRGGGYVQRVLPRAAVRFRSEQRKQAAQRLAASSRIVAQQAVKTV